NCTGFQYSVLDRKKRQIRLLKIHKPENAGGYYVRAQLSTFDLQSAPSYSALSYTWGTQNATRSISLNGGRFEVGHSLYQFLDEFQHGEKQNEQRWLWTDQICIDHNSNAERSHQAGMMSTIYSQALETLVWLNNYCTPRTVREMVKRLYEHLYFTRMWIIQELMLAKEIRVMLQGQLSVPWEELHELYKGLALSQLGTTNSSWVWVRVSLKECSMSLLEGIITFFDQECTDPCDGIYGLMGIVRNEEQIVIDYDKSIQQVLLD
ncbi:heterokaryon incompatibility protein-domain-containing protein, partial [Paraphoma chrysanthemicola]